MNELVTVKGEAYEVLGEVTLAATRTRPAMQIRAILPLDCWTPATPEPDLVRAHLRFQTRYKVDSEHERAQLAMQGWNFERINVYPPDVVFSHVEGLTLADFDISAPTVRGLIKQRLRD